MRLYIILFALITTGFLACQKEPDASLLDTTPTCRPDKIYYYDAGTPDDTVSYTYTGDQLTRVDYASDGYYTTLEYSGNQLIKRNYIETGTTTPFGYDEFVYNTDSTISKVNFYVTAGQPAPFLFLEYVFTWSNGKLSTLEHKADTSSTGTGTVPYLRYTFTYTGENITTTVEDDLVNQLSYTYTYGYDANLNYYQNSPSLILTDNLFFNLEGSALPLAFSQNNVTSLTLDGGGSSIVSHIPDATGSPKQLLLNGELYAEYFYICQ